MAKKGTKQEKTGLGAIGSGTTATSVKFALHNFKGEPVEFYVVDMHSPPQATPQKSIGHLIMILDRSGSMYGTIQEAKALIEKVFTLEEYNNEDLLVSLISYSSSGDVTTHFTRTPVCEIMKPGNRYVETIRQIQATYLTCASQAMREAIKAIGKETTCICLETDGFFNHPSPVLEQRAFDSLIEQIKPMKHVMVNAIAFGGYADYGLLSRIANALCGKCIKANSLKEVYDTLHDTASLLAGSLQPAIVVSPEGADYTTILSVAQRRVNGTTVDMTIRGARPEDNLQVFRYRKMSKATWDKNKGEVVAHHPAVYALARTKLAEGKLNVAKYTLMATRNKSLIERHAKALTAEQLTNFALDLEGCLYDNAVPELQENYGLGAERMAVVDLCRLLDAHRGGFTVDLKAMLYKRRGIKKLQGQWSKDEGATTFVPAAYDAVPDDIATAVRVSAFELNNQNATINMRVARFARLVDSDRKEVAAVAGVPLQGRLKLYRNYTLVGDGNVNVDYLPINIADKVLHAKLVAGGVLPDEPYDFRKSYMLPLGELPVVAFNQNFDIDADVILKLVGLRALRSLFASFAPEAKGDTGPWSAEQLEDLKQHYLTPGLSFQPPTTNPYRDLEGALRDGSVDARVNYEVAVGTPAVLSLADMPSANEFFARRYQLRDSAGECLKKPKVVDLVCDAYAVELKDTKRQKPNGFDNLLFPIYQGFLGMGDKAAYEEVLSFAGINKADRAKLCKGARNLTAASLVAALEKLEVATEKLYAEHIRPLAFYIGSSGLTPDNWEGKVQMLTEEQLVSIFPSLKPKKEATYFFLGEAGVLVTVFCETAYFSTPKGVEEANRLQKDV